VISRDDLKRLKPKTIADAFKAGDLNHLLKGHPEEQRLAEEAARLDGEAAADEATELSVDAQHESHESRGSVDQGGRRNVTSATGRERLIGMSPQEIIQAQRRGELDDLLGRS
jgi:hypothetical protein